MASPFFCVQEGANKPYKKESTCSSKTLQSSFQSSLEGEAPLTSSPAPSSSLEERSACPALQLLAFLVKLGRRHAVFKTHSAYLLLIHDYIDIQICILIQNNIQQHDGK